MNQKIKIHVNQAVICSEGGCKMIQARKDVCTTEGNLKIIQENNWEPVFDLIQSIADNLETTDCFVTEILSKNAKAMEELQTDQEKEEWYNNIVRTLSQLNQAAFGLTHFASKFLK